MKKKKIALLLLTGALLMNTTPCLAAAQPMGEIMVKGSSSTGYTQLPTAETVLKDAGLSPKLPVQLAGGYQFDSGNITETFSMDANGNATNKRKGIHFTYVLNKNSTVKSVTFSAEPDTGQDISVDSTVTKYGDFSLYYNDKQAYSVAWVENGIVYMLMDINKKVTKDELNTMAKEIIDIKAENQ